MKWVSKLDQRQRGDLSWYFDSEAETAAGNRSPLGYQLDVVRSGVLGCGGSDRTDDMDRASGAYRRQKRIRDAIATVSTDQARLLRAVYKVQQPSAAINELVPFFGDHGVARVAVMRCELPGPGASAVRILSQRVARSAKDKDARRDLERLRSRIIAHIGEAEVAYTKGERLCRMERAVRLKKKRDSGKQLRAQAWDSEERRSAASEIAGQLKPLQGYQEFLEEVRRGEG